jgi:putative inorganic carbon (hco3(-)) transporter
MKDSLPLQPNNLFQKRSTSFLIMLGGLLIAAMGGALIGITGQGVWIVLGFIGLLAGVIMVVRPAFGTIVLVAFIYLNFSDVLEVSFGIPRINQIMVALIFIGVIGTRFVIRREPIILRSTEFALILYGIVLVISGMLSPFPDAAFAYVIDYAKDIAIVIILIQVSDSEAVWKNVQWVVIFSAAFLASLSAYHIFTGDTSNTFFGLANAPSHQIVGSFDNTRPTGPLVDPNFYAQILIMVLPLAIYRFFHSKTNFIKGVALICAALIAMAIIFTYSRSAFIMMAGVMVLIIIQQKLNLFKVVGISIILFTLALPILPPGFLDRIATLGGGDDRASTGQQEMSFAGRFSQAIVALNMFLDRPIFGVGYANYERLYQDYSRQVGLDQRTEHRQAHSIYLEVISEMGIIGMLIFGAKYYLIFKSMYNAREKFKLMNRSDLSQWVWGLQFGLTAYLMTSIFLHDGYVRYLYLSIAMALSASAVADAMYKRYQEAEKNKVGVAV